MCALGLLIGHLGHTTCKSLLQFQELLLNRMPGKPNLKVVFVIRKGYPYSLPNVGPGADPGVQAVSSQLTISHPPGGRLPLLSARPAIIFQVAEHHRPLAGTKLCCLVTEAHRCEQLAQDC